jgi:hypothetical protein
MSETKTLSGDAVVLVEEPFVPNPGAAKETATLMAKMPTQNWRGYISTQKTVWCGGPNCSQWEQVAAGRHIQTWKRHGWKKTRKEGWLCPKCVKARA